MKNSKRHFYFCILHKRTQLSYSIKAHFFLSGFLFWPVTIKMKLINKIDVQTRVWRSKPSKRRPYSALPPWQHLHTQSYPKMPKVTQSYPKLPRVIQSDPKLPKVTQSYPELPKLPKITHSYPKMPKNAQSYPKFPKDAQSYIVIEGPSIQSLTKVLPALREKHSKFMGWKLQMIRDFWKFGKFWKFGDF